MKIHEILVESQRVDEGPLGSLAKAAGRGLGNVIGGVAKTAGAVKGAVKGAVDRAKSSFKAGDQAAYSALAGQPGSTPTAPKAGQSKPAAATAPVGNSQQPAEPKSGVKGFVSGFKKGLAGKTASTSSGGTGSPTSAPKAEPEAISQTSAPTTSAKPAAPEADPTASTPKAEPTASAKPATPEAPPKENPSAVKTPTDSNYAKVKNALAGFDAIQKKEVLNYLMSDPKVKSELSKKTVPSPAPAAKPEEETTPKKKTGGRKNVSLSQSEIDADRDRLIQPQYDSVNRKDKAITESFSLYRKR
jgi:hypothetical protein